MIRGTGIDSTVLRYVKGNGANASTKFYDDSQNHQTLTTNGTASVSTTSSKFGTGSMYFTTATGWISIGDIDISSGKWSISGFVYMTQAVTYDNFNLIRGGTVNSEVDTNRWIIDINGTTGIRILSNNNTYNVGTNTTVSLNTWHYFAVTNDTTNIKIYIDGALELTETAFSLLHFTDNSIGKCLATNPTANYRIDDMVIQKGVAIDGTKVPTRQRG